MIKSPPKKRCEYMSLEKQQNGIVLDTKNGKIYISVVTENIIRIRYTKENQFSNRLSYAVVLTEQSCKFDFEEKTDCFVLWTSKILVKIYKIDSRIEYFDCNGTLLTREPVGGGKHLERFDIYMPVIADGQDIKTIKTPDGEKTVVQNNHTEYSESAYHSKLEFVFDENEAIYGLGQQEKGVLNLRGKYSYLYQANMNNPIPFLISTNRYGIFVDNYSHMIFRDDEYGSYIYSETVDEMDYYFMNGNTFDEIIGCYRQLTGKAPMLPKWAFGYMQSRERYVTQEETLNIAKEFRKRKIPIDTIIMDWQSWEGNKWGQKSFDESRFPNPKEMIDCLHNENIKYMLSIWPNMSNLGANELELKENNCMLNNSNCYNAFSEKAREIYWKQANEGYFKYGVDAWWCDNSEPFSADWSGEMKMPPEILWQSAQLSYKQIGDDRYTNVFPFLHAKGIYENQRKQTTDKRVVNLTRAVYSGQQRYSTIIWSGDISAKWKTLEQQIATGLSMCASGIPYWTLDIGAFFVKQGVQWFWDGNFEDGNKSDDYRELYTRWLQFGAFLPVFRSHGTETEREPWFFGSPGDLYYDTIIKYIKLRYKLIPYIYSLSAKVTFEDYTILRVLAFDFYYDEKVYNIKDQYLFGNCFMVCPVAKPISEAEYRKIYFPKGRIWYDFWTNQVYEGESNIEYYSPIEKLPIFVPSGSIIPMYNGNPQSTADVLQDRTTINIYAGDNGEFTLYDDEGDNYNYESGNYTTIKLQWDDEKRILTIGSRKGCCKEMMQERIFDINIVENGDVKIVNSINYNGEEVCVPYKVRLLGR